jgi:hypothetical protein
LDITAAADVEAAKRATERALMKCMAAEVCGRVALQEASQ